MLEMAGVSSLALTVFIRIRRKLIVFIERNTAYFEENKQQLRSR